MKFLNVFFMVMLSVTAFSQQVKTTGLTDEQIATLQLQAAQMANQEEELPTADKINEWTELGQNVGEAIIATSERLGIALDEFLGTTVGKVSVALIVLHLYGDNFSDLFCGILILVIALPLWFKTIRRIFYRTVKRTYKDDDGKEHVKEEVVGPDFQNSEVCLAYAVCNIIAIIIVGIGIAWLA